MNCRRALSFAGLLLTVFLVFSCATTGPGGEKSLILISERQEVTLGSQVAEQVQQQEQPLADQQWQEYLDRIGQRIVEVSDRKSLDYHFTVLHNDQINAFAAPGGFLYFYTGILQRMDSEDELAAVMAHEVSHVVGRHSVQAIQTAMGGTLLANLILGDRINEEIGQITGLVFNLAMQGYSRSQEFEADEYGLMYMVDAGYNPNAMVTMFEKLAAMEGGERNVFEDLAASHPKTKDRIARMKAQIAAMPASVTGRPINRQQYQQMKNRLPEPSPPEGG